MKKLFSIFCCFLLTATMVIQAQTDNHITKRANATQSVYYYDGPDGNTHHDASQNLSSTAFYSFVSNTYSVEDISTSSKKTKKVSFNWNSLTNNEQKYDWQTKIPFNIGDKSWDNTRNCPPAGVYQINTSGLPGTIDQSLGFNNGTLTFPYAAMTQSLWTCTSTNRWGNCTGYGWSPVNVYVYLGASGTVTVQHIGTNKKLYRINITNSAGFICQYNVGDAPTYASSNGQIVNVDLSGRYSSVFDVTSSGALQLEGYNDNYKIVLGISTNTIGVTCNNVNNKWFSGGSYIIDYSVGFGNRIEINESNSYITITKSGTDYNITANLLGADGKTYKVKMKYSTDVLSGDVNYKNGHLNYNFNWSETTITTPSAGVKKIAAAKDVNGYSVTARYEWDIVNKYRSNIFFNTPESHIPTGMYNIDNSGSAGTVKRGNGSSYTSTTSNMYIEVDFVDTDDYDSNSFSYIRNGSVLVINPNKTTPMYVKVDGQNSYGYDTKTQIGTLPTKRSLTVSTSAGADGSASITSAEGYGYTNSTNDDLTHGTAGTGNYYYDGTTVSLVAPAAAPGYRFVNWTKGSTIVSTSQTYNLGNVSSANSGAYVANFEGNSYTVHFDGNGSTGGSMSDQTGFKYGTDKALTTNAFSRVLYTVTYNYHDATSGNSTASNDVTYTFNGWNTEKNGSGTPYTNGFSLSTPSPAPAHNDTVTLYAQWGTPASVSVTLPSPKKTDHKFLGWYTAATGGIRVGGAGDSYTPTEDIILHAQWKATHTVYFAVDGTNSYGTVSPSSITDVPDGATIVVDDNTITIKDGDDVIGNVVTATHTTNTAQYTYGFGSWKIGSTTLDGGETVTETITIKANFTQTKKQYTLTWDVNGGNALTGTYTNGTIDWGTAITKPADPTKAGYTFGGWDADNDDTADDVAATMPTSDVTYKALWNAVSSDLVLKDGVTDGQTDINFDEFAATYNGQTMSSVTLNRTFTAGNWATLCLPFYVDESQLSRTGLLRKVYEFRYATGSADAGKQVTFHFRVATSMEAGRGYLVKGESGMGSSFVFNNVTINTSADTKTDVNDLKGVNYYYDESVGSDIVIVGVLRSGTLRADGKKVMGLANNKIWYPHTSGNPMPAYRAYFYNPDAPDTAPMPRVRIVVEGEGTTELEVVDGELYDANNGFDADGDVRAPSGAARKYIRNGVLIIERNGVTYDAQGKRL